MASEVRLLEQVLDDFQIAIVLRRYHIKDSTEQFINANIIEAGYDAAALNTGPRAIKMPYPGRCGGA